MSSSKGGKGRKKDSIHFVNARPTSETERLRIQRLVRAHVGKWISDQTKDRSAATESSDPGQNEKPGDRDPASQHSQLVDFEPEEPLFPSSSPSDRSSRESPESTSSQSQTFSLSIGSASHAVVPVPPVQDQVHSQDNVEEIDRCAPGCGTGPLVAHSATQESVPGTGSIFRAIGASVFDPFHSYPSHYTPEAIHACEKYCIEVLWPGLTPDTPRRPGISATKSWFPLSMTDPTLFTAFLFGSLSHQRCEWVNGRIPDGAFRPRDQRLLQQCEYETIKLINNALNYPNRAISDATVLSVMCMVHNIADDNDRRRSLTTPFTPPLTRLQWLDVYASLPPNLVHLQGLVELIRIRGGLNNIKLPGAAPVLSFSAILTASCLLSPSIFPYIPLDEARQGLTLQQLLGYSSEDVELGFGRLREIGFTVEMADVFQALRAYTNTVIEHMKGSHPNPDLSLLCDQRNLVQWHLLTLPAASNLAGYFPHHHQETIYEACRLAALIYAVGVTFPLPSQCTPLPRLATLTQETLQTPESSVWAHPLARLALLWVLTLGGIAAHNQPERVWFVHSLGRAAALNRVSSWSELKSVLELMLWYDAACDRAGYTLWVEVAALGI